MICPNCKKESNGAKWCPNCGLHLEIDESTISPFNPNENSDTRKFQPIREDVTKPVPKVKSQPAKVGTSQNVKVNTPLIIGICVGIVILVIAFLLFSKFSNDKKGDIKDDNGAEIVLEKEDSSKLFDQAMNCLKDGEYAEAETLFKAVLETDRENKDAEILYDIVFNYNRALKKLESNKFEDARKLYDKIPIEYTDYSIRTDVENLDEEIFAYENAYRIFENVQKHIKNEEYEEALEAIDLIDTQYLTDSDEALLKEYRSQIEQYLEKKEEEESEKEYDENELTFKKAEIILVEYAENLVMAINNRDFSLVEGNIAGQLYNDQKKLVQHCIEQGITQSFDSLTIKSITKISDTKWKISVAESETIYYPDYTSEKKSFDWTYTLEYIDSEYLLTKIE